MSLKSRDEAERQEMIRRHAELYRRARRGEITTREMLRLSKALLEPYRARHTALKKAAAVAVTGDDH